MARLPSLGKPAAKKTYAWIAGRRVAARYAAPFADVLESIKDAEGRWTASEIVAAARPRSSPIHGLFEWDDSRAGELYREDQARDYVRSLTVQIVGTSGKSVSVPVAVSFRDEPGYREMENVLSDPRLRERMLFQALAEAESWITRYRHLKELSAVFRAVKRTRAKLVAPPAASGRRRKITA